jgi:replicative DNA helicase
VVVTGVVDLRPGVTMLDLPHNQDAETALLGAALASAEALHDTVPLVLPDDLYSESNRLIWSTIRSIASIGGAVDEITVTSEMRENGTLARAGGAVRVSELTIGCPDVAGAVYYAGIVKADAARRRLITLGRGMVEDAANQREVKGQVDESIRALLELSAGLSPGHLRHAHEVADAVVTEALRVARGLAESAVLTTGIVALDERVFLRHGKLVVLGGVAGTGKTSLALQIADQVASRGRRVLFASLEMSAEEITERLLAARTGIPVHELERGMLTTEKQHALNAAGMEIPRTLYIEDAPGTNPLDIRAKARQIQLREGLDLVVVDYLQRLTPTTKGRSREQEVSEMSRELKLVARSLNIPTIVLSQLSRTHEIEKRRPQKRDFRESGAIEQDADVLLALYRETKERDGEVIEDTATEVLILKQRQGPRGVAWLEFDPVRFRFTNYTGGY